MSASGRCFIMARVILEGISNRGGKLMPFRTIPRKGCTGKTVSQIYLRVCGSDCSNSRRAGAKPGLSFSTSRNSLPASLRRPLLRRASPRLYRASKKSGLSFRAQRNSSAASSHRPKASRIETISRVSSRRFYIRNFGADPGMTLETLLRSCCDRETCSGWG